MQSSFCSRHCSVFDDTEESKLIYTDIFSQYTELIEGYIISRLTSEVPGFTMDEFGAMLGNRQDEITGDVFDMLMSFTDFEEFKSLMLSYKPGAGGGEMLLPSSFGIGGSKENMGTLGMEGLEVKAEGKGKGRKERINDPLSPASREAKDAGISP
ncbi:hypothetical protein TrCOL_g11935 [Triparma columacea]|uniref:ADP-ribosylation factor-like protein 2-binding protein n=1 Tax=Triparma columacea TaxID=722753 RepID=A0A9W7LEG9_9STRA|nr:hypothetical protein TrCOL_g11935 [Triparma columacea]